MEKAPLSYSKIPQTPIEAKVYAKSAAKRGERTGKSLAENLKLKKFETGRILDAGCGSGDITIELALAFSKAEVIGLDLSEPLLTLARESAEDIPNVSFQKGDVQAMPFEDNFFDVVINMNTFHVVDDPVAMLNEIERVLKPDGVLGLGDIKRSWMGYIIPRLKAGYTAEEAKQILRQSHLRKWEFTEASFWFSLKAGELTG